jgi:lipoprotein-releasing system permease protein
MSFEWFVARRYLTARRRQAFISLISMVSILGVGVGVMALIVALALMTGVQGELQDRIVGSTAHVYVYKMGGSFDDVEAELRRFRVGEVTAAAPAILGLGLMSSARADTAAVQIKGIDPLLEPTVSEIKQAMQSGTIEALAQPSGTGRDGVVLGKDLALQLGVTLGDSVRVLTPDLTLTPSGAMPRPMRVLHVVGTFSLGFYQFDSSYALVSMATAEQLLGKAGPDFIQLRLSRLDSAPLLRARLQDQLGAGYFVQDWTQLNKSLYSALWLEKVAISLTIGLIVMVAALNIVASLVLLVMEKSRDIAILRTMGAPAAAIRRIFIYQGLTIGLVGTAVGTGLGLVACTVLDRYQIIRLNPDVYQITHLPFRVLPLDVVIVVASAVAVCFLATVYPARQAGRLDPAEALRNQ